MFNNANTAKGQAKSSKNNQTAHTEQPNSNTITYTNTITSTNTEHEKKKDIGDFFEKTWRLYPKKKGRGSVSDTQKAKLFALGDAFITAINRYAEEITRKGTEDKFIMYGSTFFNSGYVDYLDGNYQPDNSRVSSQYRDGTAHPDGGIWYEGKQLLGVDPYDTDTG